MPDIYSLVCFTAALSLLLLSPSHSDTVVISNDSLPSTLSPAHSEIDFFDITDPFTLPDLSDSTLTPNTLVSTDSAYGIFFPANPVNYSSGKAEFSVNTFGPSTLQITIFDATGNALFEWSCRTDNKGFSGPIVWNLTNKHQRRVAAGSYLVRVQSYNKETRKTTNYSAMLGITR
ncbi:hypothetical protein QA601_07105 [Chitinispirillales bacterium ANBcel5]|uniref:hypothetical protein n=1 Tax=Cellulosispirillum alkaliphilum TaxID=3039283 RepID=UPI002A57E7D7|nr:hypothetical protein [Chitinispirillales bacterium ANBcel5]